MSLAPVETSLLGPFGQCFIMNGWAGCVSSHQYAQIETLIEYDSVKAGDHVKSGVLSTSLESSR
jgi:hypothetical protein